ncbi:hypothetical protein [Frateuria defendens]|uniref:hypothetical protein n=1 Tax=Frateuria defendens TaxID=2219559 RepID=UPI00066FF679|nr:hypothetical protein [Frateuria defendens]
MKKRAVYSTRDVQAAAAAVSAARQAGVENKNISMVARSDIAMEKIPEDYERGGDDFYPAAIKGTLGGGAAGLLAGIVAASLPALDLGFAAVVVATLAGAALGAWATSLSGSVVPDAVRRKFEGEIEAGRILVVIDGNAAQLAAADRAIVETGAVRLPFDKPSFMS